MKKTRSAVFVLAAASALFFACNGVRKQECDKFLATMKPLDQGMPSADVVDEVQKSVVAMTFQDQPLQVYAKNYASTLGVLSSTLRLQATPTAPNGTGDVVHQTLKEARTDRDDVQRYCSD
jgi:hypothetical protein